MRSWRFSLAIILSAILFARLVSSDATIEVDSASKYISFGGNPFVNLTVAVRVGLYEPLPAGRNLTVMINGTVGGYVTATTNFTQQLEANRTYSIGVPEHSGNFCAGYPYIVFSDWNQTIKANPYTLPISNNTLLIAHYNQLYAACITSLAPVDIILVIATVVGVSVISRSRIHFRT